jgi:photosystem II stability/assembly factor-like uncharacterized protein
MSRTRAAVVAACLLLLVTLPAAADTPRPVLDGLTARCVGPANMGGRIVDLAVVEASPDTYYVAAAGGGVWKTTDAGATFIPLFDDQPTMSIGSVAVCQGKPDVIYVGTGEGNPRNSVSAGMGVFKSTDGGKTWTNCGLAETHHVGRVVVHPKNPDVAYVAAVGHFWGPNKERGLYKTIDGGQTWTLSKFIDENTGFVDVQMDPSDPETLYACAWEVRRDAFSGGNPKTGSGPKGGIFKTTDGGKTWEQLTGGLPTGAYGRCGVSVYRKDPNVVYAVVQTDKTNTSVTGQPPTILKDKDGNPGKVGPADTGGVFRSDDKGKSWKKLNDLCPRPFYYGQIRVDPTTEQRVYCLGVAFYLSTDGGNSFTTVQTGAHPDNHALWIDPVNPEHLILGNDGGLYASKAGAKGFTPIRSLVIGQFYGVAVDSRTPYRVYGGLQDNGSWGGPVATPYPDGITQADWFRIGGGDGFQAAVDPTDPDTVYSESQYGALSRVNVGGAKIVPKSIRPPGPKGMGGNRYNWNSPIAISPHDPKTLFFGGQFVFKTTDRGDNWTKLSPDLTRGPKDVPITNSGHNLTAIAESPAKAGVIWAGTDDGNLWVSTDGGKDWTELTDKVPGVPRDRTISRIEPSPFDAGTAFLAIDRHRNDDFKPYLFKTTDFGQNWVPLSAGLPEGACVLVVRQSPRNKDLLFAGTELGLYVSLDGGASWGHVNRGGLPAHVRVDDVVIHPRERELVVGTHGRGIWVMDVSPLEQLTPEILKADAHLFDVKPVTLLKEQKRGAEPPKGYVAPNPPAGLVVHYLLGPKGEPPLVELRAADGRVVGFAGVSGKPRAGLRRAFLEVETPGEYTVTLRLGDRVVATKKVTVKGDPPAAKADE